MSCTLTRGMGENFAGPCDLICSWLRGQLHWKLKGTPMILAGFKNRKQAYERWSFAKLTEIGVWGKKKDLAVWVGNLQPFVVDLEGLTEEEVEPGRVRFPLALPWRLFAAHFFGSAPTSSYVVADPFMDRGAVGKAALEMGVSFVGIERDSGRMALAQQYLAAA